jgi:hypothetical protein
MTDDGYCPDWWYSSDIEDMDNFVEWNMATFCDFGFTNLSNLDLFCKKYYSLFTIEQSNFMWPSKGTVKYGHIRQVVA